MSRHTILNPVGHKRVTTLTKLTNKTIIEEKRRVADEFIIKSLDSTKKVLEIEQLDNSKYRVHVKLLETEIDALKELVEKKQVTINQKEAVISHKKDLIKELEEKIADLTFDKAAFKILENQNADLCERLTKKVSENDILQEQLRKMTNERDDIKLISEEKLKNTLTAEATLTANLYDLKHQVDLANMKKAQALSEVSTSKKTILDLSQRLQWSEENRIDQVQRSRQSEYRTLRKVDELSNKAQNAIDEKNQLYETLSLAQFRGDLLQSHLDKAITSTDTCQYMAKQAIDNVEESMEISRAREKKLTKENETLQAKLQVTQKAFNDLLKRVKKAEKRNKEFEESLVPSCMKVDKGTANIRTHNDIDDIEYKADNLLLSSEVGPNSSFNVINIDDKEFASIESIYRSVSKPNTTSNSNTGINSRLNTTTTTTRASTSSNPKEILTIASDGHQLLGKQCLLGKYLSQLAAKPSLNVENFGPKSASRPDVIDLSSICLIDDDMVQVVEWLRCLSLSNINTIDMRQNMISKIGADLLLAWIISLPSTELHRQQPLEIDLKHNMISPHIVQDIVDKLSSIPRSEITLVATDYEGSTVIMYGPGIPNPTIESIDRALIRIDLRFSKKKKEGETPQFKRRNITITNPLDASIDPTLFDKQIYPQDHIMISHAKDVMFQKELKEIEDR